jgi:hypothetical protein
MSPAVEISGRHKHVAPPWWTLNQTVRAHCSETALCAV